MRLLFWGFVAVVALAALDRLLLWMEKRGWIYYRRYKPRRGASTYHLMEIHSIFEPGFEEVIEAKVHEEQKEDESGDPPEPDKGDPAKDSIARDSTT